MVGLGIMVTGGVGIMVGLGIAVGLGITVGLMVGVGLGVAVGVGVGVGVALGVGTGVGVAVGIIVGAGAGQIIETSWFALYALPAAVPTKVPCCGSTWHVEQVTGVVGVLPKFEHAVVTAAG